MNGASVIAHNVAAQYTYDRIQSNKQKQNKTIQKLSSGYKINKAAMMQPVLPYPNPCGTS